MNIAELLQVPIHLKVNEYTFRGNNSDILFLPAISLEVNSEKEFAFIGANSFL